MPSERDEALADAVLAIRRRLAQLEPWQADALCAEHPEVVFFAERGESTDPAKALCARCMVRVECADFAIANQILPGVWGGLSGRERRSARRDRTPSREAA